jgi:hypothetical protein
MTKDELLANILRDRATLDALVGSIDEKEVLAPELDDGWSVKDVLAHITSWEQVCLKWMREGRRDEGPATRESIDAINRTLYDSHRELQLHAVLTESRRSYAEMVETVRALTGDLDAAPRWGSDESTAGAAAATLGQEISANSDEHYREHIDQLQAWLGRKAAR